MREQFSAQLRRIQKLIVPGTVLAMSSIVGSQAHAEKGGPGLTVDDRIAIMDAQIALLKKEGEVNAELSRLAAPGGSGLPSVISIFGMEGVMRARIQLSNGAVTNVREGDRINAAVKVASITAKVVTVAVGNGPKARAVPLEFLAGAQVPGMPGRPLPRELLPDPPAIPLPAPLPAARPMPTPSPAAPAPAPAAAKP